MLVDATKCQIDKVNGHPFLVWYDPTDALAAGARQKVTFRSSFICNPDFRVICGIDGRTGEYRVFNSFYYHIKRTHPLYLASGRPPTGWMTAATPEPSRVGGQHFDIPIFSDCATQTRGMQRTSSEVNTPVTPNEESQQNLEGLQNQRPEHQ
ncbi:hypothetical protein JOB18_022745, partial [Solea senegalensis]